MQLKLTGKCIKGRTKRFYTHHITFAPPRAAVVHDMKIPSFTYYWAVEYRFQVNIMLGR